MRARVLIAVAIVLSWSVAHATTYVVTTTTDELNTDGDCSLREAVQAANTNAAVDNCPAGGATDEIVLAAGTYTLTLVGAGEQANQTGDLDVTAGTLTVRGAGQHATVIDGNGTDRILETVGAGVTLNLTDLTLTNGNLGAVRFGT